MPKKINSPSGTQPIKSGELARPNLPDMLFWDMDLEKIDWPNHARTIITRVIERGNDEEWVEMIRFYGLDRVLYTLKFESTYFPPYTIIRVCEYFHLKQEELRCYIREPWRPGHSPW
jgi:hypothetical protein